MIPDREKMIGPCSRIRSVRSTWDKIINDVTCVQEMSTSHQHMLGKNLSRASDHTKENVSYIGQIIHPKGILIA